MKRTRWPPEWIQRLVHLRATHDPQNYKRHMPFEMILATMQREFPNMNLDLPNLQVIWNSKFRDQLIKDFRPKHKLPPAEAAAALAQASQMPGQPSFVDPQGARPSGPQQYPHGSFQGVHALSYGTPRPGPSPSYGGPQSGYGGQQAAPQLGSHSVPYGGSQPGHYQQYGAPQPGPSAPVGRSHHVGREGQYRAPQPGLGGPYLTTPGTNQQLPPVALCNPPVANSHLPPIAYGAQPSGDQRPRPMEPPYQKTKQKYKTAASNSQAPQAGRPVLSEQEIYDQNYQFSDQQREWLLTSGMYLTSEEGADDRFYQQLVAAAGSHRLPSKERVMKEFNQMRRQR